MSQLQSLPDEEVMLLYQKGDATAMDELLRRYRNPVFHFTYRLTGDSSEAQDIAQETFMKLHECRSRYQPTGKFSTWIFSIAHNAAISHLRKNKWFMVWPRNPDNPDELREFESPDPTPEDEAVAHDTTSMVKRCIQSLPFLQKEALILREYEKMDYGEIARVLGASVAAVKTLIYRARQNLKEKLLPFMQEQEGGSHA
jgi:RNA polymerase sigma-70 factor, ECF subfamily